MSETEITAIANRVAAAFEAQEKWKRLTEKRAERLRKWRIRKMADELQLTEEEYLEQRTVRRGRPRKYMTDEEAKEAARLQRKEWYQKNVVERRAVSV